MAAIFLIFIVFILGLIVLMIASMWKIFEKAGQAGWKCLIPIYSTVVLLEIVGKPTWWIVLYFIPLVNIIFIVWTYNMLSKSFGQTEGYTIGLLLLGIIFFPMLAFGSEKYLGPFGDPEAFKAYQEKQNFDFAENKFA